MAATRFRRPVKCSQCAQIFQPTGPRHRYCSKLCLNTAHSLRVKLLCRKCGGPRLPKHSYCEHCGPLVKAEKSKKWQRVHSPNRRRRAIYAAGSLTTEEWAEIEEEFGGQCAYCGTGPGEQLDHVVPISKGGQHEASNVVPACASCNLSKNASSLLGWMARIKATA